MIRRPAVAGRFYPGNPDELLNSIREFVEPNSSKLAAIGAVIPHAGYMYSGRVAGAVYSRIVVPSRTIVLCPNHTGLGPPLSIMATGAWQTPLGQVTIDQDLAAALLQANPQLQDDVSAHKLEHAIEVQLPFLQHSAGAGLRFVPITVGTSNWSHLESLGKTLARVIRKVDPTALIIASSDMNHYEPDDRTRIKDRVAIDFLLNLNPRGLFDVIQRERISMCGFGPATSMLIAAKELGATQASLVRYATSDDVSGDFSHVVGYAGIAVYAGNSVSGV